MLTLGGLPDECLLRVLSFLSMQDLLAVAGTGRNLRAAVQDDSLWRKLAILKWGGRVADLLPSERGSCMKYCSHRISFLCDKKSPYDLIQEAHTDPWQLLVCCLMCSRTTGGQLVRSTIESFLAAYPTPSHVLDAPESDVFDACNSVGLQAVRCRAIRSMSQDFLAKDWEDPSAFWGCGKFAADSWRIFCRGARDLRGVEDEALRRYLRWLNAQPGEALPDVPCKRQRGGGRKKRAAPPAPSTRQLRSRKS